MTDLSKPLTVAEAVGLCAHCGDEEGNDSMADSLAGRCRACGLGVCAGCLATSTGQHCGHWTEDPPAPGAS